jgi:hypothetical protein
MRRKALFLVTSLAAGLLFSGTLSANGANHRKINVDLTGFEEVPVVITTGNGELKLTFNEAATAIDYVLTFSGLQADVTQSHIHVAQQNVNGGIVLWLCQTTINPAPAAVVALTPFCDAAPNTTRNGTVAGTLTSANVLPVGAQQIAAGNLDDVLIAIAAGKAYGNVHTTASPGGEIRGQLRHDQRRHQ